MSFLIRRRYPGRWHWTDIAAWAWLVLGLLLMFVPVLWLGLSSLKTRAALNEFPPTLLPFAAQEAVVPGQPNPLPLYTVRDPDGSERTLARVARVGIMGRMVDPANPGEPINVPIREMKPVREASFAWSNYTEPLERFAFLRYFQNSLFVTIVATLITLVINSMAAFALAKYQFRGRGSIMLLTIATLMVPLSVIVVPLYVVVFELGLLNSLWGVILPTVATPTGVFLLRQYMLTIPDELLDAARMDNASEWKIYWRIVLPLAAPALAVLAIFSIMWRWNDFLWPLIVLTRSELYTLQIGLASFSGELNVQWHYVLAMTLLTMAPVVLVFAFLQRFITSGIAGTGMK